MTTNLKPEFVAATDSLMLAEASNRPHSDVLALIDTFLLDATLMRSDVQETLYFVVDGARRAVQLSEHAYLIISPFVGGVKAQKLQAGLVARYAELLALERAVVAAEAAAEDDDDGPAEDTGPKLH